MRPIREEREALVPKVKECTLNVFMHPWSIRLDILAEFLECVTRVSAILSMESTDHPRLNLSAVTVIVVEHPNEIVISHTLVWWIQVFEPVMEVFIDC